MQLKGKTAIITGATGGLGTAVARELDSAGANLVLTGRDAAKLDKLASSCSSARTLAGEMTDPALPQRLLDLAAESFGGTDILFNNAGVMRVGTIDDADVEALCAMVRLNFEAAVRMAYAAVRHMKSRNQGYVVNTSSIAGIKVTDPRAAVYTGTKMALEGFTESLRLELAGTGVGIGCVEPGGVRTGLYDDWKGDVKAWADSTDMLAPEDVARAVRFMLEQPDHVRIPKLFVVPAGQAA